MTVRTPLRIGTRGSPLALTQTDMARRAMLALRPDLEIEVVAVKTVGDKVQDRPLADLGGKGLFTRELDDALLAGTIDLAVHSMKDVPTWLPEGILIACLFEREDPRDALISRGPKSIAELPPNAIVGTASLRRQAQILHGRPDVRVVLLRGNVETRLRKVADGTVDATLLALAGLNRLGRADAASAILETAEILPACAQGAVGITCRAGDAGVLDLLAALDHGPTRAAVAAERAMLDVLDGSCRTPIAGLAEPDGKGGLTLRGLVAATDGRRIVAAADAGTAAGAEELGRRLGRRLLDDAGPGFIVHGDRI